ncbi:cytochrome b/b6 domain-containing protein [Sulfurimonas sp.]|uniref:cytochrome b/b6 domain-containing protein n=1 Tax=Sulfurimonas sp. TaxID=2022749 RepID=UPI0025FC67A4|nr:cytochrome b/b6 domain-containing protein [Sulfurimonas sp.]MBW6487537.1 cytochrome b/b6 domain-containing protein [Sulfurimonas sp.]
MHKKISTTEKIIHWSLFLSFLGLAATALAAEFFFSKEAIMDSFQKSLPLLNIDIAPADQFFIARIARRDTWDVHFYFGAAFGSLIFLWAIISIYKKQFGRYFTRAIFFTSGIILTVTGTMMFLRLYYPLEEEIFGLLKKIHQYGYWIFIASLLLHIVTAIYQENKSRGVISKMLNFKTNNIQVLAIIFLIALCSQAAYAQEQKESDFTRWKNDTNLLEGIMYLEGEKGAEILKIELANCPYDKCASEDTDKSSVAIKTIDVKKPDYKKAIELLSISSANGNAIASDKLLDFLLKRTNYKSKKPNWYLVDLLKKDTSLSYEEYKSTVINVLQNGVKTNKACYSTYMMAEFYSNGYMGVHKSREEAIRQYDLASEICPENSFYKMMAVSKNRKQ